MSNLRDHASTLQDDLVRLRRELHQIPEIGLQVPATQAVLLRELEGLPLEISTGEQVSSITAVLRGGKAPERVADRPVVLLRGDMDALPVTEQTGLDFASTNGAMHACGHDLHMSLLIGAVRTLCHVKDDLTGDVVFMFQPGEEGMDGAQSMIDEGILTAAGKKADAAFAIHVFSALEPYGTFATRPGAIMAATNKFKVTMKGKGGHGSAPWMAKDPVPALAELVTATHAMVTREYSPFDPVVVTVGKLAAGTAENVIPAEGMFEATVRCYSQENTKKLGTTLVRLAEGIASAHGLEVDATYTESYPVTLNDPDCAAFTAQTVRDVFGDDRFTEWANPLTGSEDFSRVLLEVPGCYVALSAVPGDVDPATATYNHAPQATFDDGVIADGAALLAELAVRTFAKLNA
ncbi:M20 metallopeptidase family protein [Aestuariimicrobium kwangyangense]|uniref:M20 metallopeptidase family protein n=1 Tax=Aestuariimicrobium kwangyangense TaxID=396389 RepID=UPI0003B4D03E|nr:M20 family metallopeptidase [Aestuariimicrobium kwangyangense]